MQDNKPTFYDNEPLESQVGKLGDFILDTCPDQIEGGAIETAVKIIAAWNTRADPALAAAQAEVARLTAALEDINLLWGDQEEGKRDGDWEDAADDMHNIAVAALVQP